MSVIIKALLHTVGEEIMHAVSITRRGNVRGKSV